MKHSPVSDVGALARAAHASSVWSAMLRDLQRVSGEMAGADTLTDEFAVEETRGWPSFPQHLRMAHGTPELHDAVENVIGEFERVDSRTVLLTWHDATRGRFTEQRWRLAAAPTNGQCALSGRPIRRGDRVFRAQYRQPILEKDRLTILASVFEAVLAEKDAVGEAA
ncbi:DUF3331 domain-containing protein [Paraburkholderia phosphatilytica]|uniref:DUF3331 domain-containing protein n=1 Tax=Paraburkholderia phosphatilytica TaxID=2282883 RepID=UPI000E4CFA65|nr:DUF3331 domain-containing protein [Paraburkholderia phosphatilytica]